MSSIPDSSIIGVEGEGKFLGIKPINVSQEDMELLRNIMDSHKYAPWYKTLKLKKIVGSLCTICGSIPTKIATYDYVDATRIERYCDTCAEKQFSRSTKIE